MLLSSFAGDFIPYWLKNGLFLTGNVAFLCVICWAAWHFRKRIHKALLLIGLLLGLLIGLTMLWSGLADAFAHYFPDARLRPEQQIPKLKVRLVPEAEDEPHIAAHFAVENKGPGNIEVLRVRVTVPPYMDSYDQRPAKKIINEGDELTIPFTADNMLGVMRAATLAFTYKVKSSGQIRTASYEFRVPENWKDPVSQTSADDEPGLRELASEQQFIEAAFQQRSFRFAFGFRERLNGRPNDFTYSFHGRRLIVDSSNLSLWFDSERNGKRSSIGAKFPSAAQHLLVLEWDDTKNELKGWLDGEPIPRSTAEPANGQGTEYPEKTKASDGHPLIVSSAVSSAIDG